MNTDPPDTKRLFMDAFFGDRKSKIAFLDELYENERQDEALILCLVYLDGCANWVYAEDESHSHRNFVRLLCERGTKEVGLVRPLILARLASKDCKALAERAAASLGEDAERFFEEEDLVQRLRTVVGSAATEQLSKEFWRGTLANVAYKRLRNPWIHEFSGYGAVLVGPVTLGSPTFGIRSPRLWRSCTQSRLKLAGSSAMTHRQDENRD